MAQIHRLLQPHCWLCTCQNLPYIFGVSKQDILPGSGLRSNSVFWENLSQHYNRAQKMQLLSREQCCSSRNACPIPHMYLVHKHAAACL